MHCLKIDEHRILKHAIYTLINCLSCDDPEITVAMVRDMHLLKEVRNLFIKFDSVDEIKGHLLLMVSNVPIKHQHVLDLFTEHVLDYVIGLICAEKLRIRLEALSALNQFLRVSSRVHVRRAVEMKALERLRTQMHFTDQRILLTSLECLEYILKAGEKDVEDGNTLINVYWS